MPRAYRIVKAKRAHDAFAGEGARRAGGRWNSPGSRMIYTAEATSLVAIELLVHLDKWAPLASYVVFRLDFENELVLQPALELPRNWRSDPAPTELQEIGDSWLAGASSAILRVPSAIIPWETNFLINPRHIDFSKISVTGPIGFKFDTRPF